MAFRHGSKAEVVVNSIPLTLFCDNLDLGIDVDTAETTTFSKTWKTHLPGTAGATFELAGNYDPTASTGPAAVLVALIGQAAFPIVYYPGGNVAGQRKATFNAILTAYGESSPVGDKISFSASVIVDDDIVFAAVGA